MKEHIVSFVVLIAMAVNTLAYCFVVHGNLVVEDLSLFKRGEIALGYLHVIPCDIRWLDEAIRQIFVDGLFGYMYFKRVKRQPFALFLSPNLYLNAFALRCTQHRVPFRLGYLHLYAFAVGLLLAIGSRETCHTSFVLIGREHEVERRNVARHGDITIIGENVRLALGIFG